ncbi:MAG TPA: lysophospholipid acyltransferase family protein [Candidatus Anoxymicrobiaceae bacterium]
MWLRFIIVKPIGLALAGKQKYNLKYEGETHVPFKGPFILVSNHQTGVDVFAEGLAIRKVLNRSRMLPWAKDDIKHGSEGLLGRILWHWLGTIPIDRGATNEAPKAIRKSLDHLRKGKIIFVHPEGTRFPPGQLGPFMYGVANLARAVPCPVLPVGVWRRREGDNGIQVRVGVPFFLPDFEPVPEGQEDKPENIFRRNVEMLKKWGQSLDRNKKGMKLMANMIGLVLDSVTKLEQKITHDTLFRMADPSDNEYLRDRVLELLPEGWQKVDEADWGGDKPSAMKALR